MTITTFVRLLILSWRNNATLKCCDTESVLNVLFESYLERRLCRLLRNYCDEKVMNNYKLVFCYCLNFLCTKQADYKMSNIF